MKGTIRLVGCAEQQALTERIIALGWSVAEREHVARTLGEIFIVDLSCTVDASDANVLAWKTTEGADNAGMLVLIQRDDDAALARAATIGATHFLTLPARDVEMDLALSLTRQVALRLKTRDAVAAPSWPDRDPPTGLIGADAARRWLTERAGDDGGGLGLILIGLSQFETVNAAYGREHGDMLLARIASRLTRAARHQDAGPFMLARLGGGDFALAFDARLSIDRLRLVGSLLLEIFDRPFDLGEPQVMVSARVVIVQADAGETATALIRRASLTLADARDNEVLTLPVRGGSKKRRVAELDEAIDRDLRGAIAAGQIDILFQPQFRVADGAITGCEALARWQHDRFGTLSGDILFRIAARSGYVLPLSAYIQRLALDHAVGWPALLDRLSLSINVTAQDLTSDAFLPRFDAMLGASGFAADRLTVEITETGLMANIDAASATLAVMRGWGVRVAIDDFGTGYSSLGYLKRLPLDCIKLDMELTQDIARGERDRIVALAVLSLAQSLELSTVAEGVEDERQLALLRAEGCDFFQGFLRAPPLDPAAFVAYALAAATGGS